MLFGARHTDTPASGRPLPHARTTEDPSTASATQPRWPEGHIRAPGQHHVTTDFHSIQVRSTQPASGNVADLLLGKWPLRGSHNGHIPGYGRAPTRAKPLAAKCRLAILTRQSERAPAAEQAHECVHRSLACAMTSDTVLKSSMMAAVGNVPSLSFPVSCNIEKAFAERVCASPCCNELNVAVNASFSCSSTCFSTLSESDELESNFQLAFFVFLRWGLLSPEESSAAVGLLRLHCRCRPRSRCSSSSSCCRSTSSSMSRSCLCAHSSLASCLPKSSHPRPHATPIPAPVLAVLLLVLSVHCQSSQCVLQLVNALRVLQPTAHRLLLMLLELGFQVVVQRNQLEHCSCARVHPAADEDGMTQILIHCIWVLRQKLDQLFNVSLGFALALSMSLPWLRKLQALTNALLSFKVSTNACDASSIFDVGLTEICKLFHICSCHRKVMTDLGQSNFGQSIVGPN